MFTGGTYDVRNSILRLIFDVYLHILACEHIVVLVMVFGALSVTAIILRMPFSEMCFGIFGTPEVTSDVGHFKISFKGHFGPPQKSDR